MNDTSLATPAAPAPARQRDRASSLHPSGWGFFVYLLLLVVLAVWVGPMIADDNRRMADGDTQPPAPTVVTTADQA